MSRARLPMVVQPLLPSSVRHGASLPVEPLRVRPEERSGNAAFDTRLATQRPRSSSIGARLARDSPPTITQSDARRRSGAWSGAEERLERQELDAGRRRAARRYATRDQTRTRSATAHGRDPSTCRGPRRGSARARRSRCRALGQRLRKRVPVRLAASPANTRWMNSVGTSSWKRSLMRVDEALSRGRVPPERQSSMCSCGARRSRRTIVRLLDGLKPRAMPLGSSSSRQPALTLVHPVTGFQVGFESTRSRLAQHRRSRRPHVERSRDRR